jgi:hypothetical protein
MKYKYLVASILTFLTGCGASLPQLPQTSDVKQEISYSDKVKWVPLNKVSIPDDKITLVFLGMKGCVWCEKLKESFEDPEVIDIVNKYYYPIYLELNTYPNLVSAINPSKLYPGLLIFSIDDVGVSMFTGNLIPPSQDNLTLGYLTPEELKELLTLKVLDNSKIFGEFP